MKTNNLKPTICRLLIILFIPLQFIFSQSIIDTIINNYKINNINFYYTKIISDTLNNQIGEIRGRYIMNEDSIVSYIIANKEKMYFKYKNNKLEYYKNNEKQETDEYKNIPEILNVKTLICPIMDLNKNNLEFNNNIIKYTNSTINYDSIVFFINKNRLIDSVYVYKKNLLHIKTYYNDFRKNFPLKITTYNYFNNTIEYLQHFNINIY